MVGDGPERSNAEWLAHKYGIEQKVQFLGKRDNIEELMSCSDLLLLPSSNESFGLVALEAMASEVPVLVSKVGGLPEVLEDGLDGFLVEPENIEEMGRRGAGDSVGRRSPARNGKTRPADRARPILLQAHHSAVRDVLRTHSRGNLRKNSEFRIQNSERLARTHGTQRSLESHRMWRCSAPETSTKRLERRHDTQ